MCTAVECGVCGKTTWRGCGEHVDQVMAGVPEADRGPGHDRDDSGPGAAEQRGT